MFIYNVCLRVGITKYGKLQGKLLAGTTLGKNNQESEIESEHASARHPLHLLRKENNKSRNSLKPPLFKEARR